MDASPHREKSSTPIQDDVYHVSMDASPTGSELASTSGRQGTTPLAQSMVNGIGQSPF